MAENTPPSETNPKFIEPETWKNDIASYWETKTDQAFKDWIDDENLEGEAKSVFDITYFWSIDLYEVGSEIVKSELKDRVLKWSAGKLNERLMSQKMKHAYHIIKSFQEVSEIIGIGDAILIGAENQEEMNAREYFAAHLILYMDEANDFQYEPLLKKLVPKKITNGILAFNLANLNASRGKKKEMLKYMKLALKLKMKKSHFRKNIGFEKFWNDPDFLKLVKE
nr:hypothetical protein [Leptospira mayottensis]